LDVDQDRSHKDNTFDEGSRDEFIVKDRFGNRLRVGALIGLAGSREPEPTRIG
jgi:hypothetical protein